MVREAGFWQYGCRAMTIGMKPTRTVLTALLPATVAAPKAAGKRITLVDMHAAIATDGLLPDGVHPKQAGMDKMAARWLEGPLAIILRTDECSLNP